jgi:hypothetical protein
MSWKYFRPNRPTSRATLSRSMAWWSAVSTSVVLNMLAIGPYPPETSTGQS